MRNLLRLMYSDLNSMYVVRLATPSSKDMLPLPAQGFAFLYLGPYRPRRITALADNLGVFSQVIGQPQISFEWTLNVRVERLL